MMNISPVHFEHLGSVLCARGSVPGGGGGGNGAPSQGHLVDVIVAGAV